MRDLILVRWKGDIVAAHAMAVPATGEAVLEVVPCEPAPADLRTPAVGAAPFLAIAASAAAHVLFAVMLVTVAFFHPPPATDAAELRAAYLARTASNDDGPATDRDHARAEPEPDPVSPPVPVPVPTEVATTPAAKPPKKPTKPKMEVVVLGTLAAASDDDVPTFVEASGVATGTTPSGGGAMAASGGGAPSTCSRATFPGPATGATCTKHVKVDAITRSASSCFVDAVVRPGQTGTLTYPCEGAGPATLTFGTRTFAGAATSTGAIDVCTGTTFPWSDGCQWNSAQRITGSVASGGSFRFTYGEAPDGKRASCASSCSATGSLHVE